MLQALGSDNRTKIVFVMFGFCCLLAIGAMILAQVERYVGDKYSFEFTLGMISF